VDWANIADHRGDAYKPPLLPLRHRRSHQPAMCHHLESMTQYDSAWYNKGHAGDAAAVLCRQL
jgi:hypothetical protein